MQRRDGQSPTLGGGQEKHGLQEAEGKQSWARHRPAGWGMVLLEVSWWACQTNTTRSSQWRRRGQ